MDNVSPEVYSFYLRALGKSSVSVAVALYICYQVPYNFFLYVLYLLPECSFELTLSSISASLFFTVFLLFYLLCYFSEMLLSFYSQKCCITTFLFNLF